MNSTKTASEPVGYIVWHREHKKRARWKKIATVRTRAEAFALTNGPGNWWIADIHDPKLLQGTAAAKLSLFE